MGDAAVRLTTEHSGPMGVEIDGVRYDIPAPDSFGLGTVTRVDRMSARLRYLLVELGKDEPNPAVEAEIAELLGRFLSTIMPSMPAAVLAKLTDSHRLALIMAYRKWFTGPFAKATAQSPSTRSSGGPDGSPDSGGSTAEAAPTG